MDYCLIRQKESGEQSVPPSDLCSGIIALMHGVRSNADRKMCKMKHPPIRKEHSEKDIQGESDSHDSYYNITVQTLNTLVKYGLV